jgi:DNA topoisomerase IA
METHDSPITVLHQLLANMDQMMSMDSQSLSEYKGLMLQLKGWVETLQRQASSIQDSSSTQQSGDKLSAAEQLELASLRAEKATLQSAMDVQDAKLLKLLAQLRRLQFSIDGMNASVYQRPVKPK